MGSESKDERIRSFIAVDLEPAVHAELLALQRELAQCPADVRWVRPQGVHLTLKFLGSIDRARLESVLAALQDVLRQRPAFRIAVRGVGTFPSGRRPRVVWAGVHGESMVPLAGAVEQAMTSLGFAPERRAFTPHVTLGRVNSPRGWPEIEARLTPHRQREFGSSQVEAVIVYRSQLRPQGAVYTRLWTISLYQDRGEDHDTRH